MNAKTFIIGLGTGLIAGTAAVLFTTPQSGKELQQTIKDRKISANEVKDEFKGRLQSIKDSIDMIKNEAKTTLPSTMAALKESVATFQEETAPNQERLKLHLEELQKAANDISVEIDTLKKRQTKE
ncbi:YtxH domain-containing protein [Kurthia sibirica]|uniref:YtxH domain-containing protein n=1 Tax=Kurthia sibirica TaxID=202750 RepID=A0A2U3AJJ6_9BACL|nr:YtxH domain-containing protein [Kurthia sibirica]PWI24654.1 hypothetical protein DEX24_12570 [Kurthia sibirica]GEK33486.1 hypothetical protein KSI01_10190 [Kurthia sibirica]